MAPVELAKSDPEKFPTLNALGSPAGRGKVGAKAQRCNADLY